MYIICKLKIIYCTSICRFFLDWIEISVNWSVCFLCGACFVCVYLHVVSCVYMKTHINTQSHTLCSVFICVCVMWYVCMYMY